MTMAILGWYSIAFLFLSIIGSIASDKHKPAVRVWSVLFVLPIIGYIAYTLFS